MNPAAVTTAAALAIPTLICVSVAGVVAKGVVEAWPVRPGGRHRRPTPPPAPVSTAAPVDIADTVPILVRRLGQ